MFNSLMMLDTRCPRYAMPTVAKADTASIPEFRYHHTNTQAPLNEQAGTSVSGQPSVALAVGELLNKQGKSKCLMQAQMSNACPTDSNQNLAQEQIDGGIASSQTLANGIQAIATAYGDYAKKSFEDTKSFVEKL